MDCVSVDESDAAMLAPRGGPGSWVATNAVKCVPNGWADLRLRKTLGDRPGVARSGIRSTLLSEFGRFGLRELDYDLDPHVAACRMSVPARVAQLVAPRAGYQ
jgi:hypothetical protein